MSISALIVDDEPLARRGVAQMLSPHADVSVAGEARSAGTAARAIEALRPDLVFLDVQMPNASGFELLETLRAPHPLIVFVTAYEHFAVRAFAADAIDYLLKPLEANRFAATMERVRTRLRERARHVGGDASDAALRITIPGPHGMTVLALDQIDWIEADDYYAAIHARGKRYLLRESLASLEGRLAPSGFLRVHRSALVRVERIAELQRSGPASDGVLRLFNGQLVPVSRRRLADVARLLRGA